MLTHAMYLYPVSAQLTWSRWVVSSVWWMLVNICLSLSESGELLQDLSWGETCIMSLWHSINEVIDSIFWIMVCHQLMQARCKLLHPASGVMLPWGKHWFRVEHVYTPRSNLLLLASRFRKPEATCCCREALSCCWGATCCIRANCCVSKKGVVSGWPSHAFRSQTFASAQQDIAFQRRAFAFRAQYSGKALRLVVNLVRLPLNARVA